MGTYFYVPLEDIQKPTSGECVVDHWWTYNPAKGVLFWTWRSSPPGVTFSDGDIKPQCNRDQRTCEFLISRLWRNGDHQSLYLPVAYVSHASRFALPLLKALKEARS